MSVTVLGVFTLTWLVDNISIKIILILQTRDWGLARCGNLLVSDTDEQLARRCQTAAGAGLKGEGNNSESSPKATAWF